MPSAFIPSGRKSLFLLTFAAAIIGGGWWWTGPPRDPMDHGLRLSDWLSLRLEGIESRSLDDTEAESKQRLHAYGSAGFAWLVYTVDHGRRSVTESDSSESYDPESDPGQAYPPPPMRRLFFDGAPDWLRQYVSVNMGGLRAGVIGNQRYHAAAALAFLGREAVPALPALVRDLQDEGASEGEIYEVAYALNRLGSASWPAVEQALAHGAKPARMALLRTIGWRFVVPEEPVPEAQVPLIAAALVTACHDPDPDVHVAAAMALTGCCRPDRPAFLAAALPEVVNLLSDPDSSITKEAFYVIESSGEGSAPAISRLIEMLDDPAERVRYRAVEALGRVDKVEKRSAARLRLMARHEENPAFRSEILQVLRDLGISPNEDGGKENRPVR